MTKRDKTAGQNTGTLSRARALSYGEGCPAVPGDTSTNTSGRGTGTHPALKAGTSPSPTPTDDTKLTAFRARFGAILAGMTADQQAKFERDMLGGAA